MRKLAGVRTKRMSLAWVAAFAVTSTLALADVRTYEGWTHVRDRGRKPPAMTLQSGKLFRIVGSATGKDQFAQISVDDGITWETRGRLHPHVAATRLEPESIAQIERGPHKGRIVVPFYLGMYGKHPDYTEDQRGGYAIYKGKKILLTGHTFVPEMCGSFFAYSDDEGQTWLTSKGFLMGYFEDGHLGHLSCEEPVVVELKDGRLMTYMRSTTGRILKSYSEDGGVSWMKVVAADIAMSNSPCHLTKVPGTGDLVLIWNMVSADEIKRGYRRGRLTLALSKDDGETWEKVTTLALSDGMEDIKGWIAPPPFTTMVRGPSGAHNILGEIADGYLDYVHPGSYFEGDEMTVYFYSGDPPGAWDRHWLSFPISWLYEEDTATQTVGAEGNEQ